MYIFCEDVTYLRSFCVSFCAHPCSQVNISKKVMSNKLSVSLLHDTGCFHFLRQPSTNLHSRLLVKKPTKAGHLVGHTYEHSFILSYRLLFIIKYRLLSTPLNTEAKVSASCHAGFRGVFGDLLYAGSLLSKCHIQKVWSRCVSCCGWWGWSFGWRLYHTPGICEAFLLQITKRKKNKVRHQPVNSEITNNKRLFFFITSEESSFSSVPQMEFLSRNISFALISMA